jgi:hypothetical protein
MNRTVELIVVEASVVALVVVGLTLFDRFGRRRDDRRLQELERLTKDLSLEEQRQARTDQNRIYAPWPLLTSLLLTAKAVGLPPVAAGGLIGTGTFLVSLSIGATLVTALLIAVTVGVAYGNLLETIQRSRSVTISTVAHEPGATRSDYGLTKPRA